MKVAVIGLGSMGQRRIRLLKQYDETLELIGIDKSLDRIQQAEEKYHIQTYTSLESVLKKDLIDAAFVCTSPLSHHSIIYELISRKINVFTEINLVRDGYEYFIKEKDVKIFLSSTFLYRKDIQWIIQRVNNQRCNYRYHTGQFLPDWHPWESYKQFFVSDIRTNGCRELLAIELPWIVACFGPIVNVTVKKDKMSDLEINYYDNYMLLVEHENGSIGQIAIDIVARRAIRQLDVYNQDLQVYWNGTPNSLQEWDISEKIMRDISTYDTIEHNKNYCDNIIENAYMDEIDAFMTWIKGDSSKVRYGFEKDSELLQLIDEIEE